MYATSMPTPPSVEQLIEIVMASDPGSPVYDPGSKESESFAFAASELAKRGPAAAPAAPVLAQALRYPRRDSYLAAQALAAIGPAAESAIPELLIALGDNRSEVRVCAVFVLGVIGKPSKEAVPLIAPLLWDSDLFVRSAAAGAMERITGLDLVEDPYDLDPARACSVFGDEPNGSITAKVRAWWVEEGQYSDWTEKANP